MNKTGQISKTLGDFAGYGAFVIVFLLFLLLFNLSAISNVKKVPITGIEYSKFSARTNIISQADLFTFTDVTARHVLLNFLRSDDLPEQTMKMSDYAVLTAYRGSDENSLIKRRLDSYADAIGNGCYEFKLVKKGKTVFQTSKTFSLCRLPPAISVEIPTLSNELIEVSLRLGAKS